MWIITSLILFFLGHGLIYPVANNTPFCLDYVSYIHYIM
jgi:hypothetical protein